MVYDLILFANIVYLLDVFPPDMELNNLVLIFRNYWLLQVGFFLDAYFYFEIIRIVTLLVLVRIEK